MKSPEKQANGFVRWEEKAFGIKPQWQPYEPPSWLHDEHGKSEPSCRVVVHCPSGAIPPTINVRQSAPPCQVVEREQPRQDNTLAAVCLGFLLGWWLT